MLVLSRKQNEKIVIGDQITITILRVSARNVRIGIEAPGQQVWRAELKPHPKGNCDAAAN